MSAESRLSSVIRRATELLGGPETGEVRLHGVSHVPGLAGRRGRCPEYGLPWGFYFPLGTQPVAFGDQTHPS